MTILAQQISAYVLKDLIRKLSPERFPGMPPILVALTGFILGARFGRPFIIAVVVTDSGIVLARANGDTDARCVLGSYSDVLRNWMRLISTAGYLRVRQLRSNNEFEYYNHLHFLMAVSLCPLNTSGGLG